MDIKNKVFVIQHQLKLDKETNQLVPKFDFTQAEEYGEVDFLLSPSAKPFSDPEFILEDLRNKLQSLTENDYLLLVGNPILIGITTAIALDYCGKINFLQWNGKRRKYLPVEINF